MAQGTLAPKSAAGRRPSALDRLPIPVNHIDWVLVAATVAVSLIGVVMVYSATRGTDGEPTTFFLQRQAMFVGLGFVLMTAVAVFDYRHLRDWAVPLAVGALVLLFGVVTPLGSERNGAQAWYELGGFQLQPSELTKLVLIVGLASFLSFDRTVLDSRRLGIALGLAAVPMALIMLQPDLGTVLVFGAIAVGMVLVAGARPRHFAILLLVAIVGTIVILNSGLLASYQTDRLTSFVDAEGNSETAYNQEQAQAAVGAGGLTGQGLFDGTQTGLDFVPEQHTDFIFTVVGEELGFVGSVGVLSLMGLIVWRIWRTAQTARDDFGALVCAGVMALFIFQVFQNVGMAIGIMPVTGIPLPLTSYGGSSILTVFIALGLVLSVHHRRYA
ncbi:MAG: rod shape-determining protein RodA [Actinomycetota bacterium]